MRTGYKIASYLGAALIAAPAYAVDLACLSRNPSSKDWVPEAVFVSIDTQSLKARVLDEYTLSVMEGPALAEVSRPTSKRLQLNWALIDATDLSGRSTNVKFKMTLNLKTFKFNYSGVSESSFLTPGSASGTCAPWDRIPDPKS